MQPASASSPISVRSAALESDGERADRMDVGLIERASPMLQHLDEAGLVERRIRIRRTGKAGDAAGDCRAHFGFERRLVLEARLAQARGQVDQSRGDDEPVCVERAVGAPRRRGRRRSPRPCRRRRRAMSRDRRRSSGRSGDRCGSRSSCQCRPAAKGTARPKGREPSGQRASVHAPPACSSPPSAPRCRTSPAGGSPIARRRRPPSRSRRHGSSAPDA